MSDHDTDYPSWIYYPIRTQPPAWVHHLVSVVRSQHDAIDSSGVSGLTSDIVLSHIAPGLADLGYVVETGKRSGQKVRRPVLFGEQGRPRVTYEVDAVHDEHRIVLRWKPDEAPAATPSTAT